MKTMKHVPCYGIQLHAEHILLECIFFIAIASAFIKLASFCFAHVHMFDLSNGPTFASPTAVGRSKRRIETGWRCLCVLLFWCYKVKRTEMVKYDGLLHQPTYSTQSSTWILWYDRRKELQQPTIQHGFVFNDFPQRMKIPIVGW